MTTTFSAPSISCGGCANAIRRALSTVPGVSDVSVDVAAKTVIVTNGTGTGPATILAALDKAGFPATETKPATSQIVPATVP